MVSADSEDSIQLDDSDGAGRKVDGVRVLRFVHFERFISNPIDGGAERLTRDRDGGVYAGAAVDLGQTLLRFENAIVVEERNDPASVRAVDEIFNVPADSYWSSVGEYMREHMSGKGCDALIYSQEIC